MLLWERLFSYRWGHQLGTVATGIPAEGEVVGPSSTECTSVAEHHFNPLREMLVTVFHTHQRAEELLWRCGGTELAPVLVRAALRPEMWDSGWGPEKMRLCDQSGGTADYHSRVWASATFVK